MPSYSFLDNVELHVQTGKFPVNASKSLRKVIRTASKSFIYKDGCLLRSYRGRLLHVVRSEEEAREILARYHDNNHHAGRVRAVKEIMRMYYWVGVTESVRKWILACSVCQSRLLPPNHEPPVQFCLVYGCDASSYANPELSFHRFPKAVELRQKWLAVAQRDEGSLRTHSHICSRHFHTSSFTLGEDGQQTLSPVAVPTFMPVAVPGNEVPVPSEDHFLYPNALEDALSSAMAAAQAADPGGPAEGAARAHEHQYCLQAPAPDFRAAKTVTEDQRKTVVESCFITYNHIARYLSTRVLPMQGKKRRAALKRMAKRFDLIDGVLMYTRVSPPLRVPRSREEVNSILQQFHDNQGHYGQGLCQPAISKHFYWATLTRDLSGWISSCHTCLSRTKRKWLRCSVYQCSNCCGPVERGLGLTFHKFPLHNQAVLTRWVRAVGRSNWHPRLWSSICSAHFSEDCFLRGGQEVALRPEAVPTLKVHDSATPSRGPARGPAGDEAFFAKYDAVERYLNRRLYPAGLSYVEKNTFRRFCKKFVMKDSALHMARGEQVRLVLRNQQQVEAALLEYHNELNHLDANKCLRLLSERYFWKSMRPDVVQWINNCPLCNLKRLKPADAGAERAEELLPGATPPHRADSETDEDTDGYEDEGPGGGGEAGTDGRQTDQSANTLIPSPGLLQTRPPLGPRPGGGSGVHRPGGGAGVHRGDQSHPPRLKENQEEARDPESSSVQMQDCPRLQEAPPRAGQPPEPGPRPRARRCLKRALPPARGQDSCGLEPVVAPSTKPWPVFTIANAAPPTAAPPPQQVDSPPQVRRARTPRARTVVQQCSQAKVKVRPALDGAGAQWVEIQEGMVVYVCFFHGATEDVVHDMASGLLSTKMFRKDTGHWVSLLDLPGSVLLVPQDSLLGEPLPPPSRRVGYRGGCEAWWGAQLFSSLVSACGRLLAGSAKCSRAGVRVEHGLYGQKQELVLSSPEPLSMVLEF
ncbi:uncharacterized protein LOC133462060 isoform X2 [Cololabis saira]|uniref:uncharacterized protein LOC133462060 isoform X2 n=1 Tax=Cololabis saira TaxID=129043 RepID=UPI002AD1F2F4|nr:uncharacterized protein LOC133462060 isoform X2 [Cololabis saira]